MKPAVYFASTEFVLIATLLLLAPVSGMAQQRKPNQLPTSLAGVTTTAAPPQGFDPRTASDQDLTYYGFPPRPDAATAPVAFARWQHAMTGPRVRIVPNLQSSHLYSGPAMVANEKHAAGSTLEFNNWSGYVNLTGATSYAASFLYAIAAEYVVPVVQMPFGSVCPEDTVYQVSWVGIDGYSSGGSGSKDVLQAGTFGDSACEKTPTPTYLAWYEWYPNPMTFISNMPAAPSDDFYVEVWNTSSTTGSAYLLNRTANLEVTINFSAPAGVSLVGNSLEWIVERPTWDGTLTPLANYVSDPFFDAVAWNWSSGAGIVYPSSASSDAITMLDNNGNPVSYPTLLGTSSFVVQDEGSALGSSIAVP